MSRWRTAQTKAVAAVRNHASLQLLLQLARAKAVVVVVTWIVFVTVRNRRIETARIETVL